MYNEESNGEKEAEKLALKEIDSYKDENFRKFRFITPRYGLIRMSFSDNRYFNKIIKTIKKEIKNDGLTIDGIELRVNELLTEKYGEPMSQEEADELLYENIEKKYEEKFGVPFRNRQWFQCRIEEKKHSTFANINRRNVDTAYVFIEEDHIEIIKESVFLKSKMGNRKIFYENIASIDYDAQGRLHASNSLEIHLKSSENVQLKFVQKKLVNLLTSKFEEHMTNKNNNRVTMVNTSNKVDDLVKYAELYEKGLLTKEEFDAKKKELL